MTQKIFQQSKAMLRLLLSIVLVVGLSAPVSSYADTPDARETTAVVQDEIDSTSQTSSTETADTATVADLYSAVPSSAPETSNGDEADSEEVIDDASAQAPEPDASSDDVETSTPDATAKATSSSSSTSTTSASETKAAPEKEAKIQDLREGVDYAEGEVIAVFKEDTSDDAVEAALKTVDATASEVIEDNVDNEGKSAVVAATSDDKSVAQTISELSTHPEIEYVQPNYRYALTDFEVGDDATADDQEVVAQSEESDVEAQSLSTASYGLNDQYSSNEWHLGTIGAQNAWSLKKTSKAVSVAVLDTGCQMNHPDLVNNIVGSYDVNTTRACTTDSAGAASGHGTHVAGIVAAQANNAIGVAGVSYNAGLVPIRVFDDNGYSYTSSLVKAYEWLTDSGNAARYKVRVINMSLANVGTIDTSLSKAITKADDAGILTVCAAGNSDISAVPYASFPSDYSKCVSVINTTSSDVISSNSNYNTASQTASYAKDIAAPGTGIYSTYTNSRYVSMSGTSMASPVVAGVAAVMFAAKSSATPSTVSSTLYSTAKNMGNAQKYGHGRVDMQAAVKAISGSTTPSTPTTTNVSSLSISVPAQAYSGKALQPNPTVKNGSTTLSKGVDYVVSYSNNTNEGTGTVTVAGIGHYTGSKTVGFSIVKPSLSYSAHVQSIGWQSYVGNGQVIGTVGRSLRMEAFKIALSGLGTDAISASAHVQGIGWMSAVGNNQLCGTSGQSKRVEALTISLSSQMKSAGYHIYYRVHAQNVGWMGWASDGAQSGTAGLSKRLEGIQIVLVAPGGAAPGDSYGGVASKTTHPYINTGLSGGSIGLNAMVHIQKKGNTYYYANRGSALGTTGSALRLEAMQLSMVNSSAGSGIKYCTHVQNIGWQGWKTDGALSGTTGKGYRLEALRVELYGPDASNYDVYYRTHVQNIGWTGWAMNGQSCGSAGYGYRMEAMQIMIVPKNGTAPGLNASYFHQR